MGASRESLNLRVRWKYGGKNKIKNIFNILKGSIIDKHYRKVFILDNFTTPYHKTIGCKLNGHSFKHDNEDNVFYCTKCYKWLDEKQYFEYNRFQKIKKIKRKL